MTADKHYHIPVMLNEVIEGLNIIPHGTYVDCTFGGGGHSRAILDRLNENGRLIVFDQDQDAFNNSFQDRRLLFIQHNFRHLQRFLRLHKITSVDGLLADLGVSSHQFDEAQRGFSTRFNAPLDMRMDQRQLLTAAEVISSYSAEKLQKMFEQYGEVTNAKTLASVIVNERSHQQLNTINNFRQAIFNVVKGNPNKYFAQVFQALRIEVNQEMESLKELLQQIPAALLPKGRAVIITFHSLEDRLVKNFFKNGSFTDNEADMFGNRTVSQLKTINKKPLLASSREIKDNPRSRSAKVRIAEKI